MSLFNLFKINFDSKNIVIRTPNSIFKQRWSRLSDGWTRIDCYQSSMLSQAAQPSASQRSQARLKKECHKHAYSNLNLLSNPIQDTSWDSFSFHLVLTLIFKVRPLKKFFTFTGVILPCYPIECLS